MTWTLADRTVFVTGAARGIGEHVARQARARGARVFLAGLEPTRLRALAEELDGGWYECDVRDQTTLDAAVRAAVDHAGGIDVVVANAGIANLGTVAVSDADALVRTIEVNLNGVIRTVCASLPHVRTARGYYLLISSAAAFTALPGMAAYCAAKAGVEQFGTVLRMELAHTGVRVGTAHPSWIRTDLVRGFRDDLPSFRATQARLPWPMRATTGVEECAAALVRSIERRSRRVYVPRAVAVVQALRAVVGSRLADAVIRRAGRDQVARLEDEVRALGRSFGSHSMGESTLERDHADQP